MKHRGYYDIWTETIFGTIFFNDKIWIFIETTLIPLDNITRIINKRTDNGITILSIETISGDEYSLKTIKDLDFEFIIEADCYGDSAEYNLGLYIESLWKNRDVKKK